LLELLIMENPEGAGKGAGTAAALRLKFGRWLNFFRRTAPVLLAAALSSQTLHASEARSLASKGTRAYGKKDYPKAYEYYGRAVQLDPKNPKIIFNSGDVFYRLEDYSKAREAFEAAAEAGGKTPGRQLPVTQKARYNEGNAYFMQGDYRNAVASYRQAVLLNPKDTNAKFNLQRALEQLQENKKNQQQKDKQDKNQDKKDKDKGEQQKDKNSGAGKDQEKQRQKDEAKAQADRLLEMMKEKEKSAANKDMQSVRFQNSQKRKDAETGEDW